ncbi:NAD(P)-binding protein [Hyaloscypha variabilis F]|uniref:NAD(P)-binding protein n=1 Tax=Hyaloscypha variabilis (strain UAMH 11265 / GT02V1 / F) TaxID=1149755 RepID=A0A2J6RGR1_HYAVF|nr:NAD(P)-binding protein [Hyaloscypha variabilis F]
MGWFASFLYSQLFVTLPKPTKDFTGQTIIVTGSNTGLGLEAARHLSALNATLIILAVRNTAKGETAKQSILASTGHATNSIEVWNLDMQSYDSINTFCAKANTLPRLDAVLENAGIMTKYFKLVAGYEATITTNVIGTFLLALGLLPKLKQSAAQYKIQPRLSIVASDLHFIAKFPEGKSKDIFAALNDENKSDMSMERYAVSKLLQVFAVRELASLLSHESKSTSPSVINCMTPGACKSDFDRESTGFARVMGNFMAAMLARTTEEGSRTLVAGLAAGEESQGGYMADCKIHPPGPMVIGSDGAALQKKVWEQLVGQLETVQPGISQNI